MTHISRGTNLFLSGVKDMETLNEQVYWIIFSPQGLPEVFPP